MARRPAQPFRHRESTALLLSLATYNLVPRGLRVGQPGPGEHTMENPFPVCVSLLPLIIKINAYSPQKTTISPLPYYNYLKHFYYIFFQPFFNVTYNFNNTERF